MVSPAIPAVVDALRERLEALERESNTGFGRQIFNGQTRLCDIQAWGVVIDPKSGLTVAQKGAHVVVEHEMVIEQCQTNNHGTLHGAFQALLLDGLSSSAVAGLAVGSTWESGGVSTDFQIRFLSPGQVGSTIRIISSTMKQGARLAVVAVKIVDKATGAVIAEGTHTKADIPKRKTNKL